MLPLTHSPLLFHQKMELSKAVTFTQQPTEALHLLLSACQLKKPLLLYVNDCDCGNSSLSLERIRTHAHPVLISDTYMIQPNLDLSKSHEEGTYEASRLGQGGDNQDCSRGHTTIEIQRISRHYAWLRGQVSH